MDGQPFSYANLANASLLETLYDTYKKDPNLVDPSWRYFFSGMEFVRGINTFQPSTGHEKEKALHLIQAYKRYGYKKVSNDPLSDKKEQVEELSLQALRITQEDLALQVPSFGFAKEATVSLGRLREILESVFCHGIGFEIEGLSKELDSWFSSHIESMRQSLSPEEKITILDLLIQSEAFETFLHTKYPGQTRFSLEGGETLIPLLVFLQEKGAELGIEEIVLGMPHRGRLNVLAHVLHKPYEEIFSEFEEISFTEGAGDVKYHKGAHTILTTKSGHQLKMSMTPNPSHLESINPIVEGKARAKQDLKGGNTKAILPVLLHGDASLAGQGVVYETLQMSRLPGYGTGGTLHIVVNNHIGYTTLPFESRSTPYPTDIAKAFGFPVLHVNAEQPEECILALILALTLRQYLGMDLFLDMGCYRKYGHNEGDEPSFTQPLLYEKIRKRESIRHQFEQKLLSEGILSQEEVKEKEQRYVQRLQEASSEVTRVAKAPSSSKVQERLEEIPSCSLQELRNLGKQVNLSPEGFYVYPKLQRLLDDRIKRLEEGSRLDWGLGEQLAFASLVKEGFLVRLSGQDAGRGTFAHRHAIFVDAKENTVHIPFQSLGAFQVYNSPLSEFGVMGFDLGYSYEHPKALVLWEAQFGDFVNEAQVIIDQYLATTEQKWTHHSNLTLLLPHGYEGKGPEHSSARVERFLQLCAEDNFFVANCSTPAQLFHLLRRQAYIRPKRPLVLFTPKSLLRHPGCVSSLQEFCQGSFLPCLDDLYPRREATKLLLCTGKLFYELLEKRGDHPISILRLEQLYPFPHEALRKLLSLYPKVQEVVFVQEEPKNMGAWEHVQKNWQETLPLRYVGRKERASPATGSYVVHKKESEHLFKEAFAQGGSICE